MEELLNKLIEKGWKPFGEDRIDKINWLEQYVGNWNWGCWSEKNSYWRWKSTRQLVSKESGLWQFVCEKGYEIALEGEKPYIEWDYIFDSEYYDISDYQYWLMVGALLDEDKLEDFLLSNIKVEGEV